MKHQSSKSLLNLQFSICLISVFHLPFPGPKIIHELTSTAHFNRCFYHLIGLSFPLQRPATRSGRSGASHTGCTRPSRCRVRQLAAGRSGASLTGCTRPSRCRVRPDGLPARGRSSGSCTGAAQFPARARGASAPSAARGVADRWAVCQSRQQPIPRRGERLGGGAAAAEVSQAAGTLSAPRFGSVCPPRSDR